jgi:hypothetical protein
MHAKHADNSEVNDPSGRVAEPHDNNMLPGAYSWTCLTLASSARRSNAWPMAYQPHRFICVLCMHRLPASGLKFFLGLRRHKGCEITVTRY